MFTLEWPWLLLLLPLPLLVYWFVAPLKAQSTAALRVPFLAQLNQLVGGTGSWQQSFWQLLLAAIIWIALVFAASNPLWVGDPIDIPQNGRDLLLLLDLSPSMATPDMRYQRQDVTRLAIVKQTAREFIDHRQGDRLGLIVFGEQAYLMTPLTFDRHTVREMLDDTSAGLAGERTAIGDAIALGIKQLVAQKSMSHALVLLTDGANNAGQIDPRVAAEQAKKLGIKIYTIGLGADEISMMDMFGNTLRHRADEIDEKSLQQMAELTGGEYFRATDSNALAAAMTELDRLEPTLSDKLTFRPRSALYPWVLLFALCCSLILFLQGKSCIGLGRTHFG
ncbi:MAG: VWA domain-containing protein [Pseudomonadota bacterium]|nr:VWA domain-containing protein [Pseudomonadota bacterium]